MNGDLPTAFIVCLSSGDRGRLDAVRHAGRRMARGLLGPGRLHAGHIFHLIVAMAGLAAILHSSAVPFQAVRLAGVLYLLWMACAVLNDHGGLSVAPGSPVSAGWIIRRGLC